MKRFNSLLLALALLLYVGCSEKPETILSKKTEVKQTPVVSKDMEYVEVCNHKNDCRKFSRLIMGTDHLVQGGWVDGKQKENNEKQLHEILNEAVKLGINAFDTSPIYVGRVEYKLGKWLKTVDENIKSEDFYYEKGANPDKKLYMISKGGFPFDLYHKKKLPQGVHSEQLKEKLFGEKRSQETFHVEVPLEKVPAGTYASRLYGPVDQIQERVAEELGHTLDHLGGDIAVYLMHRDDGDFHNFVDVRRSQTPVKRIMKALSSENIANRVWGLGVSNWKTNRVTRALAINQEDPTLVKPVLNSPYFSLFEMTTRTIHAGGVQVTHEEMMDPNFQKGIKIMPYSPLGGFSILDKPEPKWENGKKEARRKYVDGDPYWRNVYYAIFTEANEARYKRVVEFTKEFNEKSKSNYTVDQMINAYALAHKRTDFLTVGPITVEQLRRTVQALKLAKLLTKRDLDYLYYGNE